MLAALLVARSWDRAPAPARAARSYWLTCLGGFWPELPSDCYVWEGGVESAPGQLAGLHAGRLPVRRGSRRPRRPPWTCIAPGIGLPTGWHDPSLVWGDTRSMGCGVYFERGTPVEPETWGAVKSLYR